MDPVRVAVAQLCSTPDVEENLASCARLVAQAADRGARLVALPENAPFLGRETDKLKIMEPVDGPLLGRFRALARNHTISILVGSFPEAGATADRCRNTSVLVGPDGSVVAVYRKIHLFDVELPGGQVLLESDAITPGTEVVNASHLGMNWGLSVCYDLRFPELYRQLRLGGAEALFVPSAFTARTGPDHWQVLLQARAIENQCYVIAPGQWGHHMPGRDSHGRSVIIDPWGTVVATVSDGVGLAVADLDPALVAEVRRRMPCIDHARLLNGP
jgi:deaminated glutathione amidase